MTGILSLIMDIAVMGALGGTIYYTLRLSKSLNSFKSSRDELRLIIQELSQNIEQAQRAIDGLKKTSNIAADNLDGVLHESKKMAAEMKLINETSENLAGRLEKLAEKNRKIAQGINQIPAMDTDPDFPSQPHRSASASNVDMPSFFIQDREYDEPEENEWLQEETPQSLGQFASQAEKDLYDALQKNKKKSGGGRS